MAAMQEAMKKPEVQKQMAEMQAAMQNQALQERMAQLKALPLLLTRCQCLLLWFITSSPGQLLPLGILKSGLLP